MAERRSNIIYKRFVEFKELAVGSEIITSFLLRCLILRSFQHRASYGQILQRKWSWGWLVVFFLLSVLGIPLIIQRVAGDQVAGPAAPWITHLPGLLIFAGIWGLWQWRRKVGRSKNDALDDQEFATATLGQIWAEAAEKVLRQCASKEIAEKLDNFKSDVQIPYRVLRGYLPVPVFEFRRPEEFIPDGLAQREKDKRARRLFEIDCLSAGVLPFLGSKPHTRFGTEEVKADEAPVYNLYWRADVQEVPDADQSDIFLRFHQSVIDRGLSSTCRYRTFACLNNFRQTPILILSVRDVVDCLTNASGTYSGAEYDALFEGFEGDVTPSNVLDLLQDDKYEFYPPRIERIGDRRFSTRFGPILKLTTSGVMAMQFDPARVWVKDEDNIRHIYALAALRHAIHLASRTQTVGVVLKKRDLLVVDNRLALVARMEDRPLASIRESIASRFSPLEGRWLRKIYGFPKNNDDPLFPSVSDKTVGAGRTSAGDFDNKSETGAGPTETPAWIAQTCSSEMVFNFGADPADWPDFLKGG